MSYKLHKLIHGYILQVFLKVCEVADAGQQLDPKTLHEQRAKPSSKTSDEKTESLSSHNSDTRGKYDIFRTNVFFKSICDIKGNMS